MTGKVPTPQGISALLNRAGFKRAERGRLTSSGFEARAFPADQVTVRYRSLSTSISDRAYAERLDEYAKVINEAGYAVVRDSLNRRLIVTARKD